MSEGTSGKQRPLLPPAYLLAAVLLMVGLHFLAPLWRLPAVPWRVVGAAVIVVAGIALIFWAHGLFRRAGTAVKPTEPSTALVLDGPYRFTRNPMYLGMVLMLTGIAIGLGSVTPFLVIPVFIWQITRRFIVFEEQKLEATFGEPYRGYRERVRRWI